MNQICYYVLLCSIRSKKLNTNYNTVIVTPKIIFTRLKNTTILQSVMKRPERNVFSDLLKFSLHGVVKDVMFLYSLQIVLQTTADVGENNPYPA